jgi:tetratricopeptide (TPR) repeat protein
MSQPPWIAAAALSPFAADALFQKGEFAQAREGYRALHQAERELWALLRLDRWEEARALGQSHKAPSAELLGLLALASLRAGEPQRAQVLAERAERRSPESYWPLVARGTLALRWEADRPKALGYLRSATRRRPEIPEGWLALLAATHDVQEATQSARELNRLAPHGYPFDFWSQPLRSSASSVLPFLQAFPEGALFTPVPALPAVQVLSLKRDPQGMLFFEAELDGQRLRLLYDTGAGRHFVLTPQAVARLKSAFVAKTTVTGLQGQSLGQLYRAERLRLDTLELGAVLVESAPGNLGGFDGLVGWRIFGERVQELDLRRLTLTLREEPDLSQRGTGGWLPLHLVAEQPVLEVRCRVGSKTPERAFWAILDTGASRDFFSLRAGAQLTKRYRREVLTTPIGIGQSHPKVETRSLAVGFDLLSEQGELLTSYAQASAASFLDSVHSPATGFEYGLLLGMDFCSRFATIELDPVGRRLRFTR